MTDKQRVDQTSVSTLAVCTCGWREMVANRMQAREAILVHARQLHPECVTKASTALHHYRGKHA